MVSWKRFRTFVLMNITKETWNFVRDHQHEDVRKLALQGSKDQAVDLPLALQQIAGRQTARCKLPSWAAVDEVCYPPHLNMEQCSSEHTARYKAGLLKGGTRYVDLTGGFGVDFFFMSQAYQHRVYVEQDASLCDIAKHNFQVLGLDSEVLTTSAADYLQAMEPADVIYLDPARRNEHGARTYGIEDCTPNVLELLPLLIEKSQQVILKLSPMLDWQKAVRDLGNVAEVHIVSVDNECKELLLLLQKSEHHKLSLFCVNNDTVFQCHYSEALEPSLVRKNFLLRWGNNFSLSGSSDSVVYLYEPNASVMKAGCFDVLQEKFPISQLSSNSHLFVSTDDVPDFPGRRFQVVATTSMNKKELRQNLSDVTQANITVRNFPLTVQQLRQKLKLKDGGDVYIFATTVSDGSHKLFLCRKIG